MSTDNKATNQERWPLLADVNVIEMLSYLGTSQLSERHESSQIEWVITGVFDNTFNGVVRAQLSQAHARQVIDEMGQRFRTRKVPHLWFLNRESSPADLMQRLEARGWTPLMQGVGMAMDLSAIADPRPAPPGFTVERVVDKQGLSVWGEVYRYADRRDEPRERLYLSLGLSGSQPLLRHYVARLAGVPAGVISLFLGKEAVGIYSVEVARSLQRRGVGTAMTRTVLLEAQKQGYQVAVVAPSIESRTMYQRLGFVLHRSVLPCYWYPTQP